MKTLGSFFVRFAGFLWRVVGTKVVQFVVVAYARYVPSPDNGYSFDSSFVVPVRFPVSHVLAMGSDTKVAPSVVRSVLVYMVNFARRPFAFYHKIGNAGSNVSDVIKAKHYVTFGIDRSSYLVRRTKVVVKAVLFPAKNAGIRIVVKKFASTFRSKLRRGTMGLSHSGISLPYVVSGAGW